MLQVGSRGDRALLWYPCAILMYSVFQLSTRYRLQKPLSLAPWFGAVVHGLVRRVEYGAAAQLNLIDQKGQHHQVHQHCRQVFVAGTVVVFQAVALILQRVESFVLHRRRDGTPGIPGSSHPDQGGHRSTAPDSDTGSDAPHPSPNIARAAGEIDDISRR